MSIKPKPNTRTERVLIVMNIVAWLAFVGLSIVAGSILVSYSVSCFNPIAAKNLYMGLNLYLVREYNFWHYTLSVFFMVAVLCMKAFITFLVIMALSKVNLMNPFKIEVARILGKISTTLLIVSLIALVRNIYIGWLDKKTGVIQKESAIGELLFMAGLVFIIAQVFKRGIEIQSENDLTV